MIEMKEVDAYVTTASHYEFDDFVGWKIIWLDCRREILCQVESENSLATDEPFSECAG